MFVRIKKRPSVLWADHTIEFILVKNRRVGPKFKQQCTYLGSIRLSRLETNNRVTTFWKSVRRVLSALNLPDDVKDSAEEKIKDYIACQKK